MRALRYEFDSHCPPCAAVMMRCRDARRADMLLPRRGDARRAVYACYDLRFAMFCCAAAPIRCAAMRAMMLMMLPRCYCRAMMLLCSPRHAFIMLMHTLILMRYAQHAPHAFAAIRYATPCDDADVSLMLPFMPLRKAPRRYAMLMPASMPLICRRRARCHYVYAMSPRLSAQYACLLPAYTPCLCFYDAIRRFHYFTLMLRFASADYATLIYAALMMPPFRHADAAVFSRYYDTLFCRRRFYAAADYAIDAIRCCRRHMPLFRQRCCRFDAAITMMPPFTPDADAAFDDAFSPPLAMLLLPAASPCRHVIRVPIDLLPPPITLRFDTTVAAFSSSHIYRRAP